MKLIDLNSDTLKENLYQYFKQHPKYGELFKNFSDSGLFELIIDILTYLTDNLNTQLEILFQNLFLDYATDSKAISQLLKLINYQPKSVEPAEILLEFKTETIPPNSIIIPPLLQIEAIGLNGDPVIFEIMKEKNNYFDSIVIPPTTKFTVKAWSGETYKEIFEVNKSENFSCKLEKENIIYDSIKVYFLNEDNSIGEEIEEIKALLYIENYDKPFYYKEIDYLTGEVELKFGNKKWGGYFKDVIDYDPTTFKKIVVFYRTDNYNKNANILKQSIDTEYILDGITWNITNISSGYGGSEKADIQEEKNFAPKTIALNDRLVTKEDYEIIIKNQSIIKISDVKIVSPEENPKVAPYLFNVLYILPYRDLNNFEIESGENKPDDIKKIPLYYHEGEENYYNRFLIRLKNFINLEGIAGYKEIDIGGIKEKEIVNERIYPPEEYPEGTESYLLHKFLKERTVLGIDNIFKIINIYPIKFEIDVFLDSTRLLNEVKEDIIKLLETQYGINNRKIGEKLLLPKIYKEIQNIRGINYCVIKEPKDNLSCNYNELLIVLPQSVIEKIPIEIRPLFEIKLNFFT